MLIDIVNSGAAHQLLSVVERCNKHNTSLGILHFRLAGLAERPTEDGVLIVVRPVLEDKPSAIYFFEDGDVVITWTGMQKSTRDALCNLLYARYYRDETEKNKHHYYDAVAHAEDVRMLCHEKEGIITAHGAKPEGPESAENTGKAAAPKKTAIARTITLPQPTAEQFKHFRNMAARRESRKQIEILVVEDQAFSRKLLLGLLDRTYRAEGAETADAALSLYWATAPDIVFLDIELPDADGHAVAAVIAVLDPDAYIVMVTANNKIADIQSAKSNNTKGFIVKPYSRQKIVESIDKFKLLHRNRSQDPL